MQMLLDNKSSEAGIENGLGTGIYNTANAQAAYLSLHDCRSRKELCHELECSQAGITRAKKCFQQGFDPCRKGRHKKLNDADENLLVSWILDLLDEGETVYTPKIIEMVCLYLFDYYVYSSYFLP